MKKTLCAALAIILCVGCFAGCGEKVSNIEVRTPEELSPEKIGYYSTLKLPFANGEKITMFMQAETTNDLGETVLYQELEKRTGLDLEVTTSPLSTYAEKSKVLVASGKLPDIFQNSVTDLYKQGALEPIDTHFDELPNLREIFIEKKDEYGTEHYLDWIKAADGHNYAWPVWNIQRDVNHGMLYRKDILDKHGIKMWNSTEEFVDVLRQLKKLYPDSTPFTSKTGTTIFVDFAGMYNIRSYKTWTPYFNEEDGVWKQSLTDPTMKEILDLLKQLYNEKLFDQEFLTNTSQTWTTKMTQPESAFVTFDWIDRMTQFKQQTEETIPDYDLRFGNPIGTGKVRTLDKVWGSLSVAKSENSILALKLLDYSISESGAQLTTLGVEGVTYEIGEDGFANYLGFEEGVIADEEMLKDKYGLFTLLSREDRRSANWNFAEQLQEAQDMMNNKEGGGFNPFDPVLIFNSDELNRINELQPVIQKAAEEFFVSYVLNEGTGENDWKGWLEKADKLGSGELVDIYNAAYTRQIAGN